MVVVTQQFRLLNKLKIQIPVSFTLCEVYAGSLFTRLLEMCFHWNKVLHMRIKTAKPKNQA